MGSRLLLIVNCLVRPPACSRNSSKAAASTGGFVVWLSNGWSDGERAEYYHLPEGSELMPYALLANLVSVKTGQPFLTQLERFGFLPDDAGPANPHGLPDRKSVV